MRHNSGVCAQVLIRPIIYSHRLQVKSTLQPSARPAVGRQAGGSRQARAVKAAAPAAAASTAGELFVPRPGRLDGWHLAAPPLLRELAVLVRHCCFILHAAS